MVAALCGLAVLGGGLVGGLPAQAVTTTPVSPAVASKVVNITSWLNVRPDPSTAKTEIGRLANGAAVSLTGCVSNGWLQIKTSTIATGYVTADYISVPVVSVTMAKASASLAVGATASTGYTIFPACASNLKVTFTSSNTAVLTVDSTGKVTGKGAGTASVTVKTTDGGKVGVTTYTVTAVSSAVTDVSLNKTASTLVIGDSESLTATVSPSNAANKGVSWLSSDTSVVTVDASGKVTAQGAGKANVIVMTDDGSKTAACAYTVIATAVHVTGVALNKSALALTAGKTETLQATVTPLDATYPSVTWASSNSAIATVDATGKVTAVTAGTATVTVTTTDGSQKATCTVTVSAAASPNVVTGVTISPTTAAVMTGKTTTLKATVAPSTASQSVVWASAKTATATVSSAGVVTGKVSGTGKSAAVVITVLTTSGAKTATSTVQVYTAQDVQTRLNALSCKDASNKKLVVDGVFGTNSANALKNWQKAAGLSQTGTTSSAVLIAMFAAAAPKCGTTSTVTVTGVAVSPTSVSVMTGKTTTLKATVSPSNASASVTWSSAKTATATVSTSGVVTGKVTGVGKSAKVVITVKTVSGAKTATSTVQVYTAQDVQTRLNALGCKDASKKALVVDGIFGTNSTNALKNWQKAAGLTQNGTPSSATLNGLFAATAPKC